MLHVYVVLLLAALCHAFYLPGVAPTDYEDGEKVPLLVNALTPRQILSESGQLESVVPYDYYYELFNFCQPLGGAQKQSESLGSILFGDRIFNSPFELHMKEDKQCEQLCPNRPVYDVFSARFTNKKILQGYAQNWFIDGLPAGRQLRGQEGQFFAGFELGQIETRNADNTDDVDDNTDDDSGASEKRDEESDIAYLNNHYDITVEYHTTKQGKHRVVGVEILPQSMDRSGEEDDLCAEGFSKLHLSTDPDTKQQVLFTYSVTWKHSDTPWATRWDKYLQVHNPQVQWFAIINSAIVVTLLATTVATVLTRALRKDIASYNEIDLSEEVQEDSGWKLVHGDVFRTPKNRMILSAFLGSGAQMFVMCGLTVFFAVIGFLSPSNRGALGTAFILFYSLSGFVGGFVSRKFYNTMGGENVKMNLLLTPVLIPSIIFAAFIGLNFFLIAYNSAGAVPFGTMLALVAVWFAISVPLSIAGGFIAKTPFSVPVKTNQIPRQIPQQPFYLEKVPSVAIAGILPFVAIFVELYFIVSSIWFHRMFYMFGFLFLSYGLMLVSTVVVTVLMIYLLLCSENYHWQWRSFFIAGSCAFYVYAHALLFLINKLALGSFTSNILYLGYSAIISLIMFVLLGTVGYTCSFFFVRKIYTAIKID